MKSRKSWKKRDLSFLEMNDKVRCNMPSRMCLIKRGATLTMRRNLFKNGQGKLRN